MLLVICGQASYFISARKPGPADCSQKTLVARRNRIGDVPMQLPQRSYSLASCYENALTIILRLSSLQAQQAGNSQDFRLSIRAALKAAMEQAKTLGYSSEINQLAFFAAVAFLDESVLKTQNPAFADWAQRPLQEEMFGHNRAGEVFFDHLQTLLIRPDSPET